MIGKQTGWLKFLCVAGCLALAACGGGGSGSDSGLPAGVAPVAVVLEGQVADGYLRGAEVFLDRNFNKRRDNDEPWAESGAQGRFSLQVPGQEVGKYPLVVAVVAGRTVDEDYGSVPVTHSYVLETPIGRHAFISPLTTLVRQEMEKNPGISVAEAEVRISSALGIGGNASIFDNYLATGSESDHAHRLAQVTAGLMASVLDRLQENLGSSLNDSEHRATVIIAGDLVINNVPLIVEVLRAPGADYVAVESLVSDLLTTFDLPVFDQALVDRYTQRLVESSPVWDALPPAITSRFPDPDQDAPVNCVVTITFAEELDPAVVGDNILWLQGETGSVTGSVFYDSKARRLSFTPHRPLDPLTDFTVTLSGNVADRSGNRLGKDTIWRFRTIFDIAPPAPPDF